MKNITLLESLKKGLPVGNIKIILLPLLSLVALLLLFVFSVKTGISKIQVLQNNINSQKGVENTLRQKEELLKSVEESVSDQTATVNSALPGKNPVLATMYQVRSLGLDGLVQLSGTKAGMAGSRKESSLEAIGMTFTVQGQVGDVLKSINKLKLITPLTAIDKVEFQIDGYNASANVSISSYWSPLPDKIPSLTQPVGDITQEEKDILSSLLSLTQPPFGDGLLPQEAAERDNPFGF